MDKISSFESKVLLKEKNGGQGNESDVGLDEFMDDLEDDEFLSQYREKRMQQISDHLRLVERNVKNEGFGSLKTIEDESTLMRTVSGAKYAVVHFELEKFAKCQLMDQRLSQVAEKHLTTMFLRISVENSPFLVSKLGIKVLPFVVCYKDGQEILRIVGFSKLGNNPASFTLESLINLLSAKGVINKRIVQDDSEEGEGGEEDSSD